MNLLTATPTVAFIVPTTRGDDMLSENDRQYIRSTHDDLVMRCLDELETAERELERYQLYGYWNTMVPGPARGPERMGRITWGIESTW